MSEMKESDDGRSHQPTTTNQALVWLWQKFRSLVAGDWLSPSLCTKYRISVERVFCDAFMRQYVRAAQPLRGSGKKKHDNPIILDII